MKTPFAWIAGLFKKETSVDTPTLEALPAETPQAIYVPPAAATPVAAAPETDFDKLRDLLKAYGHKIGDEWEHLLAAAKTKM